MLKPLQLIIEHLCLSNSRASYIELTLPSVLDYLNQRIKTDSHPVYNELIIAVSKLKLKHIPPAFIERFCINKLADRIMEVYPVNIAEAFALGYIVINYKLVQLDTLYFKLGNSGLLTPTVINGQNITDIEAIAQFMIKSLADAELISIFDNKTVSVGSKFKVDF